MRAWAVGWTRGGPLLIRDIAGEWGKADDPTLVPRIYMAEQFAKNGIRANRDAGKRDPIGGDWSHCFTVSLDIQVAKPNLWDWWRNFLQRTSA